MELNDTANKLLDVAQQLVQGRGYNAFSYKDLAAEIGIKTASIHYHFPSKADLGVALLDRYKDELAHVLEAIDRKGKTNKAKLKKFIALYRETETSSAICLCGSLASDFETLPEDIQNTVQAYFDMSEKWVAKTIDAGRAQGEFVKAGNASNLATGLIASLQGGLILSRTRESASVTAGLEKLFFESIQP